MVEEWVSERCFIDSGRTRRQVSLGSVRSRQWLRPYPGTCRVTFLSVPLQSALSREILSYLLRLDT